MQPRAEIIDGTALEAYYGWQAQADIFNYNLCRDGFCPGRYLHPDPDVEIVPPE